MTFALWFQEPPDTTPSAGEYSSGQGPLRPTRARDTLEPEASSPQALAVLERNAAEVVLARRVQGGDVDAFEQLFRQLLDSLLDFAITLGVSREAAQDIVSDIFFAVWKTRVQWAPAHVRAYFFGATRNRVHSEHARLRRTIPLSVALADGAHTSAFVDPSVFVDASAEAKDLLARLDHVLLTLPPLRRAVITLRLREQMSYAEIASVLGLGENAAQAHVSRAMRAIRDAFADL